ncbi:MgtC/SapB family protein [Pontibacter cellulosilyticus]|uniref:MgtC/SapB family protein n=1 Tax=Pontibacter cellulosilyticus TaxID=1720253 RepID=A0A923N7C2_9BACT|nr:MgtC/SapB family protein [Pontibacter cellulosilyticus]MBC5993529.1 MgtC/SapB family protein [Pontibacter cellulosilyticus]
MESELFQKLGISLGLGLLVGLQRQHEKSELAGIRTFPLFTLFGSVAALLSQSIGGWVLAAGLLSVATLVAIANILKRKNPHFDPGLTTEAAALLMFVVGAYVILGDGTVAIAIGATTAVLLHLKETLHRIVERIGEKDLKAIMQFVVILLIILPILPNETYGPYDVLNPHNIWLMVVLIVGISLLGYFAYKIFGGRAGTILGGILGGLISSTATTVSYARRSKDSNTSTSLAATVIFIATFVSVARIITEVAVVAPDTASVVLPPLATLLILMLIVGLITYLFSKKVHDTMPEQGNPAQFKAALVFGAVYALVILATAFAKDQLGNKGLFIVAIISGLTDVDAITLSTARLMNIGNLDMQNGWKVILVAALSNLVFKGVLVGVLGNSKVFARVGVLFGIVLIGGLLVLWLWPAEFNLSAFLS